MRGIIYDADNAEWQLPLLFEWEVCHGTGESCDYFEISFPYEKSMMTKLSNAVRFVGNNNGETVFSGVVDEYRILCDEDGNRVTVSGRSMAALLMDNEAEACTYASLSLDAVIEKHVKPWGISKIEKKSMPRLSLLTVGSGESEWSVLTKYCRYSAGIQPRFSKDGTLVLTDKTGKTVKINGDTPVFSIKRRNCRYGIISSVLVKNKVTGARYTVHNTDFEKRGGKSRRVLTVPKTTGAAAMRYTGEYQIRESEREKNTIELGLLTQFAAFPGDVADIYMPDVGFKGEFKVIKSRCWADGDDAGTILTLEV